MRFKCRHGCGFTHENTNGMWWSKVDDEIVHQHEKECPIKPREKYMGEYK